MFKWTPHCKDAHLFGMAFDGMMARRGAHVFKATPKPRAKPPKRAGEARNGQLHANALAVTHIDDSYPRLWKILWLKKDGATVGLEDEADELMAISKSRSWAQDVIGCDGCAHVHHRENKACTGSPWWESVPATRAYDTRDELAIGFRLWTLNHTARVKGEWIIEREELYGNPDGKSTMHKIHCVRVTE